VFSHILGYDIKLCLNFIVIIKTWIVYCKD